MWLTAARTLTRLAELGERAGRVFTLENLNTAVDHPGTPFARAADTLALVEAVDSPHLRMNLDLYHAQIGEGNLIQLVERALPLIGEIQVADVPGPLRAGHRARSTTRPSPPRWTGSATRASSPSRAGRPATRSWRWTASAPPSPPPPDPGPQPPASPAPAPAPRLACARPTRLRHQAAWTSGPCARVLTRESAVRTIGATSRTAQLARLRG